MGILAWAGFPPDERREVFGNPCCGFYKIYKFYAHDNLVQDLDCPLEELKLDNTQSLCLLEINLMRYQNRPLHNDALKRVEQIFSWFEKQGKEMIVRFLYDWDGKGLQYEPQEIGIILRHMEQLGPMLLKYSRQIYILQGLFIGSWGEMHSSRYLDERSLTTLAHKLYACSGRDTFIALRCPNIWRAIFRTYEPLSATLAYGKNMPARFGLYNDGLLSSETDSGTYGTITKSLSTRYSDKLTRREELLFQEKLCRFVPNGGETIGLSPYHEFKTACRTFATIHISYLNSAYDPEVLKKWKNTKTGLKDPFWKEKSIYDYMASHLGYRFTVEKVKIARVDSNRKKIKIEVEILNKGFAGTYRPFTVALLVRTPTFKPLYVFPAQTDSRHWLPETTVTLRWDLDWTGWESGIYVLGLKITDPLSKKTVRLANTYPLDHNGMHNMGYLKLKAGI